MFSVELGRCWQWIFHQFRFVSTISFIIFNVFWWFFLIVEWRGRWELKKNFKSYSNSVKIVVMFGFYCLKCFHWNLLPIKSISVVWIWFRECFDLKMSFWVTIDVWWGGSLQATKYIFRSSKPWYQRRILYHQWFQFTIDRKAIQC